MRGRAWKHWPHSTGCLGVSRSFFAGFIVARNPLRTGSGGPRHAQGRSLRPAAAPSEPRRVTLLDLSLPTPAENLALDEALLDLCDAGGPESLRFWESPVPFVVVGYGNRVAAETNQAACAAAGVPVLRRCSGGGTVVQGPGCLNYNLVLRVPESGPLTTVTGTNRFVMERMRGALQPLLASRVTVEGHTDLCLEQRVPGMAGDATAVVARKFSGNAQRRRRHALVFHGTLLLDFDLALISGLLLHPSAEPDYRSGRDHLDFVTNLGVSGADLRQTITAAWSATDPLGTLPETTALIAKHGSAEWTHRA